MPEEKEVKSPEVQPEPKKEVEEEITTLHERTIATLSYAGPLAIIPFYLKKDSKFCRFHGKQGLLLAIIFFLVQIFTIIDFILDVFILLQVIIFFYMGMAALSGRWKKMPLVYEWACRFEESLRLKTKEEEEGEVALHPDQVSKESAEEPVRTHETPKDSDKDVKN